MATNIMGQLDSHDNEIASGCWVGHNSTIHWYPSSSKLGDPCFCGRETMSLYDLSRVSKVDKSRRLGQ